MASFHPFPRLPLELRIKIWSSAFEPGRRFYLHNDERPEECPPTPPPPVVQACRESRQHSAYRKAYKRSFKDNHNLEGRKSEYLWINYDADTIILNENRICDRIPGRHWIRFLEIPVSNRDTRYAQRFKSHMHKFTALEAITIIHDHITEPLRHAYYFKWPCPLAQVRVLSPAWRVTITLHECVFLDNIMLQKERGRPIPLSGAEMDTLVYEHLQAPLPPSMGARDPAVAWWPGRPPKYCYPGLYPHGTPVRRAIESHR